MSAATGLGLLDLAILEACEHLGATNGAPYLKTSRVVQLVHERTGIGPRTSFEPLCDMARPYVVRLALIDFHGNYGSPDFGPAAPRYTECRLTSLGAAALAAERGHMGPLPIGLINGDTHVDGTRPPLDPRRTLQAIRAAATVSDAELASIVGLPAFPTGCMVAGDTHAFADGRSTQLHLAARITDVATGQLLISHLPPDCSATQIVAAIQSRLDGADRYLDSDEQQPLPIRDVNDHSTGANGTQLVVTSVPGTDLEDTRRFLDGIWGVRRTMTVCLGNPIAAQIRTFSRISPDDLDERLALIESAIAD
jgi:DNA gyrase subunit A